jgi:hypothetical protein
MAHQKVTRDEVLDAIRNAERTLGRYRYHMRPYSAKRQKKLADAENLLTEAYMRVAELHV